MNRRKAIFSIFLMGGAAGAGFSGYKWFSLHKTPDILFLENNKALIADLAETIIPATDTPGAKAAMAHITIISMIKEVAGKKTANTFIDGLKEAEQYATGKYGKSFTAATHTQQQEIVGYFRDKERNYAGLVGKIKNKLLGKSFFQLLKEYTTIAFCTSRTGATETLAYDHVPGKFNGCLAILPGQKSWATK